MIYLIHGPDTYRSRRLLKSIVDEFKKKTGSSVPAVFRIDAEEDSGEAFHGELRTHSFFSRKRLFVIERALSIKNSLFSLIEPQLASWAADKDSTLVFWEGDCAPTSPAFGAVRRHAVKIQEFSLLKGARLERWIDGELSQRDLALSRSVCRTLMRESAGDLWRLSHILEKLEVGGSEAAKSGVPEEKMWNFTDSFLADRKRSLVSALRLSGAGVEEVYMVASLARTLRSLLAFRDAFERNVSPSTVAKKLNLYPFVAEKLSGMARVAQMSALVGRHKEAGEADDNIKTGKLPAAIAFLALFVRN